MRFLKSDEVINDKLADLSLSCLETKALTNNYQMIKVVRMVGAKWGFQVLEEAKGEFAKLDEGLYKLVRHVFKLRRANPANQEDAGKMFETMVNKVTYQKFLKSLKGGFVWDGAVKTHLDLNKHKNTKVQGFAPWVVEKFGLVPDLTPKGTHAQDLDEGIY